jgi:hypothetical protein
MLSNLFKTSSRHLLGGSIRAFASSKPFNYQLLQLDEIRSGLRESAEKFAQEEIAPLAE